MIKTRVLAGLGLFAALGLSLAYILATGYLALKLTGSAATLDWGLPGAELASDPAPPSRYLAGVVWLIFLFATLGTLLLGSFVVHEGLTPLWRRPIGKQGPELKRNGFFSQSPGAGSCWARWASPNPARSFSAPPPSRIVWLSAPHRARQGHGLC